MFSYSHILLPPLFPGLCAVQPDQLHEICKVDRQLSDSQSQLVPVREGRHNIEQNAVWLAWLVCFGYYVLQLYMYIQ